MANKVLAVVMAAMLLGCLASEIRADANLCSDKKPLETNLLQIAAANYESAYATEGKSDFMKACPSGFDTHYVNGFRFCLSTATGDYASAMQKCQDINMQLVEITSAEKAAAVDSFCTPGCTWLGLTCPVETSQCDSDMSQWLWNSADTKLSDTYNAFQMAGDGTIEGGSPTEYCAHWWRDGQWGPHSCTNTVYYGTLCEDNAQAPTAVPTPSPTADPTAAPTETTLTAFGDPHLKNIKRESFEVRRAGAHTLLSAPRGAAAVDVLLNVGASFERVESGCSSLFIRSLDITGQWLGSVRMLRFAGGSALPGEADGAVLQVGNSSALSIDEFLSKVPASMIKFTLPAKEIAMPNITNKRATLMMAALKFGPGVRMKVSWTSERTPSTSIGHSLWVSVTGLATASTTFGGLLGEDDHHDATMPDPGCIGEGHSMFVGQRRDYAAVVEEDSLE